MLSKLGQEEQVSWSSFRYINYSNVFHTDVPQQTLHTPSKQVTDDKNIFQTLKVRATWRLTHTSKDIFKEKRNEDFIHVSEDTVE